MDDTNLSGLDLEAAMEYIFAYAVDAKRLDKEIADAQGELERWKGRVGLAEARLAADPSMASLAQASPQAVERLNPTVLRARQRLDQALQALQDQREVWDRRKSEWKAHRAEVWRQRKAEWKQAMAQRRAEFRLAWVEWKAARLEVRRAAFVQG